MDTSFPTLYKRTEIMYLGEFEEDVVYALTEDIYRQELLKLFGLEVFEANIIDEKVRELYEIVKENQGIIKIVSAMEEIYGDISFVILFSYDYFYLFYPCIQAILSDNQPDIEELIEKIKL